MHCVDYKFIFFKLIFCLFMHGTFRISCLCDIVMVLQCDNRSIFGTWCDLLRNKL